MRKMAARTINPRIIARQYACTAIGTTTAMSADPARWAARYASLHRDTVRGVPAAQQRAQLGVHLGRFGLHEAGVGARAEKFRAQLRPAVVARHRHDREH